MAIRNRQIDRVWRSGTIWAKDFNSVATIGVVSTLDSLTLIEDTPNTLSASTITSTGALQAYGSDVYQNINSLGVGGVKMNTDGRVVKTLWVPPEDLDVGHPTYWKAIWASGSTDTADTVLWKLFYKQRQLNNDVLTATVDTALSTAIATDTVPAGAAYTIAQTASGKISAGSFGNADMLILSVEMDTKDTDMAEDLFFLGLRYLYLPHIGGRYSAGVVERGTGRVPELPSGW